MTKSLLINSNLIKRSLSLPSSFRPFQILVKGRDVYSAWNSICSAWHRPTQSLSSLAVKKFKGNSFTRNYQK